MGKRVRVPAFWMLPELVGKKMRTKYGEEFTLSQVGDDGHEIVGIREDGSEEYYYPNSEGITVDSDDDDADLCPWLFE